MGGSWLDQGHGDGESLAPVTGVPSQDLVELSDRGSATWHSRSGKAAVAALAVVALLGSAGTAYAIRETLFPSLGAPTSRSVWRTRCRPMRSRGHHFDVVSTTSTSTLRCRRRRFLSTPHRWCRTPSRVWRINPTWSPRQVASGGSGRRVSHTVAPDDSGEHVSTTATVTNTGPSVPESVETTPEPESGVARGDQDPVVAPTTPGRGTTIPTTITSSRTTPRPSRTTPRRSPTTTDRYPSVRCSLAHNAACVRSVTPRRWYTLVR